MLTSRSIPWSELTGRIAQGLGKRRNRQVVSEVPRAIEVDLGAGTFTDYATHRP